jgi:hypothetical protein
MDLTRSLRPQAPPSPRACPRCGCRLARDNNDNHCSPCRFALTIDEHRELLLDDEATPEYQAAFESGGVVELAHVADCSVGDAIGLAIRSGLVPRRWRSSEDKLRALVELEGVRHVEVAVRLGVSRWTVATWRDELGLQAKRKRRPNRSAAS